MTDHRRAAIERGINVYRDVLEDEDEHHEDALRRALLSVYSEQVERVAVTEGQARTAERRYAEAVAKVDWLEGKVGGQLTPEQVIFASRQVARWLQLKFKHENRGMVVSQLREMVGKTLDRERHEMIFWREMLGIAQLCADADHSALLRRLLEGKEPLPEPPPIRNAYPIYPDDDERPPEDSPPHQPDEAIE